MENKGFQIVTALLLLLVLAVAVIVLSCGAGAAHIVRSLGQNETRIEDMSRERVWQEEPEAEPEKWSFETVWSFEEAKPEILPAVEEKEEIYVEGKYTGIVMTEAELELLAKIVYLEARGESAEGQQAVVEVVFNRVLDPRFPGTVEGVIFAPGQFCTVPMLEKAYPTEAQYAAIGAAINSEGIVGDAIYFATRPLTKNCVRQIGCHYFCK